MGRSMPAGNPIGSTTVRAPPRTGRTSSRGEIHARSVFLQGLLLVEPERIPEPLAGLRAPVARFRRVARERGLEPAEAALGFALGLDTVDVVLCGVQRLAELDALLAAAARAAAVEPRWFAGVGCADAELLDPSQWPALVP